MPLGYYLYAINYTTRSIYYELFTFCFNIKCTHMIYEILTLVNVLKFISEYLRAVSLHGFLAL